MPDFQCMCDKLHVFLNVSLSTHLPCLPKLQGVGQKQRILKSTDSRPKIR